MNPCSDFTMYCDREMTTEERTAFEKHLTTCAGCRDRVRLWHEVESQLVEVIAGRAEAQPKSSPESLNRLLRRGSNTEDRVRRLVPAPGWILATAAVALLGLFAWGLSRDEIYVFFDDQPVKRDIPDGWIFDAASNRVSFQGQSCKDLRQGDVTDIDVVYGCDQPVVE